MEKDKVLMKNTHQEDLEIIEPWVKTNEELILWAGNKFSFPIQLNELIEDLMADTNLAFTFLYNITKIRFAGIGCINEQSKIAFLGRFIVNRHYRRNGFGKNILDSILNFCKIQLNMEIIYLNVFSENKGAVKLYKNEGFRSVQDSDYVIEINNLNFNGKRMFLTLKSSENNN